MSNFRGWLLRGLCLLTCCMHLEGAIFIVEKARKHSQCSNGKDCPSNSMCENTQWGNFCICVKGFHNYNEDLTVTCPEGRCEEKAKCKDSPELCYKDTFLCCSTGEVKSVMERGGNNTTVCADKCIVNNGNCPEYSTCINAIGNIICVCQDGYTYHTDGVNNACIDTDECSVNDGDCPQNSFCNNTIGSFSCVCQDGYTLHTDGKTNTCRDLDECSINNGNCPKNSFCNNTIGNFSCVCQDGFTLHTDGKNNTCIDKCIVNNGNCPEYSTCINAIGNINCVCQDGYTYHTDGINNTCIDTDECSMNDGDCPQNSFCNNTMGSFSCVCQDGYTLHTDGKNNTCIDINECSINNGNCPRNSFCNNTIGSFSCVCQDGYTLHIEGQKKTCIDIDECSIDNESCPKNSFCNNSIGNFSCVCQGGFTLHTNGEDTCIDLDECSINNGNCPKNYFCNNSIGNFSCVCENGFTLHTNGEDTCIDLDECSINNGNCTRNSFCNNTIGSFSCICQDGYTFHFDGQNKTCIDLDECSINNGSCPKHSFCNNSIGNFSCVCENGFTRHTNGEDTCIDLDECSINNGSCPKNSFCKNSIGNFSCVCQDGFTLHTNGEDTCIDLDECSINNGNCPKNSFCNNSIGNFSCVCENGFTLHTNGEDTCIDINECSINNGNCPRNSFCNNAIGSFSCVCQDGYTLHTEGQKKTCIELTEKCGAFYPQECSEADKTGKQCSLLDQLDHIHKSACMRNNTNLSIENVTNEISQVLNQSLKHVKESLDRSVVTSLLNTVEETMLMLFTQKPSNRKVSTPELVVSMKTSNGSCYNKSSFITLELANNSMTVPCGLVPGEKDGAIFILYNDLDSSLTGALQNDPKNPENHRSAVINSYVVTGAISIENTEELDPPVEFHLMHQQKPEPSDRLQCVLLDGNFWSSRGCDTKAVTSTHTLCSCSRLSSFAILTSFEEQEDDWIQILLTYIGLSVSLLCLVLSFLTFVLRRSLRSAHTSVLLALIGSLFLAQLLFLLGIQQTWNRILCSIIAGSLQFLFLCAFSWMSIESILLFLTVRNLQAMNYLTSRRSNFPLLCIAGFGVPVVIVTISAAIRPLEYGTSRNCWLTSNIIWSFLGPILVHIMVNTTLLIITLCLLRKKLASLNSRVSALKDKRCGQRKACRTLLRGVEDVSYKPPQELEDRESLLTASQLAEGDPHKPCKLRSLTDHRDFLQGDVTLLLVFKSLAQVLLLGCTWILGYFQFGSGAAVMAYVFILLNSLQGFFIFLVHCLLNRQVREEYKKLFHRMLPQKSEFEALSNSTVPITVKSINMYETTKGE